MNHPRTRTALALFALGILLAFSCKQEASPRLEYEIVKSQADSLPALEVRMHFTADSGKTTYVRYDDEAWGQTGLFNSLREVRLLEGQGSLLMEPDSGRIRITHPAGAGPMVLSYKIVQDTPGPKDTRETYRPIVEPGYFHVFSHNLFALPQHYQKGDAPLVSILLKWTGWGPDEVIHNSFGNRQRTQDLGTISLEKFHSAIFVGGDFRIYADQIQGNELYLAIRGNWIPFGDGEVMDLLSETVRAQRQFWKDHSQPYFTVTMRPFPQDRGSSFQGTGLTNSFATSVSNNAETELDQMGYLFNHELMHNWIGHTIENENEEEQYWFSEGFTEYYTHKNIASQRIGGKDWGYFIGQINEGIRLLEASPVKGAPNSEITYENFWKDPEYGKLPYRRGMLFAFYLDLQLQAVSGGKYSLDDVMRDLLRASRESGQKLTHAHFLKTVGAYLPEDLTPFFNQHILHGEALPLEELFGQLGFEFQEEADLFDLGFRFSPERTDVTAVDPGSEAYRAGVRDGDRVVSRNIYLGNTRKEVELVLERGGRRIPVAYYPVKKAPVVQLLDTEANRGKLRK